MYWSIYLWAGKASVIRSGMWVLNSDAIKWAPTVPFLSFRALPCSNWATWQGNSFTDKVCREGIFLRTRVWLKRGLDTNTAASEGDCWHRGGKDADWVFLLTLDLLESLGRGSSSDLSSAEAANMLLIFLLIPSAGLITLIGYIKDLLQYLWKK